MLFENKRVRLLSILTALSVTTSTTSALAAVSNSSVADAVEKARVLAPGIQLRVNVKGEQAHISTFRNKRANDQDCKIEALLIGKTIFEIPDANLTSITVYFYDSKAPSQYKSVTVRTADVKAFSSGAVGKEELLSSIQVKSGKIEDPATAIENKMMLSAAARRDVQITRQADELQISCKMPPLSEEEYKFEAYRIAQTALAFGQDGSETKRVKVLFFTPGDQGKFKQVVISLANIPSIQSQLASAFGTLQLTAGVAKVKAADLEPTDGALMKERTALLDKIKALEEKGVGVMPFIQVFQSIESKVGSTDEAALKAEIERLSNSVDEQEKRFQEAQAHKPVKDGDSGGDSGGKTGWTGKVKKTSSPIPGVTRWAFGFFPMPEGDILNDPDGYLKQCKAQVQEKIKGSVETYNKYPFALLWIAAVLKNHGREDEATKFERMAGVATARIRAAQKKTK